MIFDLKNAQKLKKNLIRWYKYVSCWLRQGLNFESLTPSFIRGGDDDDDEKSLVVIV